MKGNDPPPRQSSSTSPSPVRKEIKNDKWAEYSSNTSSLTRFILVKSVKLICLNQRM